ncbi:4-coumarate--CoA ligase-like 7 [Penicillium chermesinum]|uniref:4-coumarate--CoA ligase-like 7 n=1 Tax=Penicillium chermesinum TaxID=63820 RepID=A0A9W9NP04_9EURO|nr:4-coumarate--CoA ligase-like 7 [Penicillium chermesinum]KAJ5223484.1 4-coumarate--CoA ligase-like 7 [Penicillium chermesinum]
MVFLPDPKFGRLGHIPDNIPISEFMLNEEYGRLPHSQSRDPYTCGLTGKTYSSRQVADRVDHIARGLAKEFNWSPNKGTEWDKTIAVFTLNTIDSLPLFWAVHRLAGLVSPANAAYSAEELKHQLLDSNAKALFTCAPLLPVALDAAALAKFPEDRIYLLDIAEDGKQLPALEPLNWGPGKELAGLHSCAILKGVKIAHRNVIANVLQDAVYEKSYRDQLAKANGQPNYTEVALGLLPQSHIYGLVVICHAGAYRGDQTIVLPKFELKTFLAAIQNFKINTLFLVPPIIINMLRSRDVCSKYDLSSATSIFTGAAPLGAETAADFRKTYPNIIVRQAYGLTETSTLACATHPHDIMLGSSGCLIPGYEARLLSPEGQEITSYDTPGELVLRSPSVVLGYLNNEKATKETFEDGWMRTGDEAEVRVGPKGTEHIFIVDRIKELIKVKGLQVAPAELEAHLLTHDAVADCAVIAIPDDSAGEVPKAIVVKTGSAGTDDEASKAIIKYVQDHKARHKWLKGGVRFVDAIPKSPSGKILRRMLRDQEKELRRKASAKL